MCHKLLLIIHSLTSSSENPVTGSARSPRLRQLLAPPLHPGIALGAAVVIGIEPLVPGCFESAVVAVIKTMMQLVEKIAQPELDAFPEQKIFIATMRSDRGDCLQLHDKQGM